MVGLGQALLVIGLLLQVIGLRLSWRNLGATHKELKLEPPLTETKRRLRSWIATKRSSGKKWREDARFRTRYRIRKFVSRLPVTKNIVYGRAKAVITLGSSGSGTVIRRPETDEEWKTRIETLAAEADRQALTRSQQIVRGEGEALLLLAAGVVLASFGGILTTLFA